MLREVRASCAFLYLSQLKSYHMLFFINLKSVIYFSRNKAELVSFLDHHSQKEYKYIVILYLHSFSELAEIMYLL